MAYHLNRDKKEMVLNLIVEGNSIRSAERITGVHRDTIGRLLLSTGDRCRDILEETMWDIPVKRVQADKIWTFVGKKQKRLKPGDSEYELGDQYVFIAMDTETKLIPVYLVGKRNEDNSISFINELLKRTRGKFQLTTDAFPGYKYINTRLFEKRVDYAQLIKVYRGTGGDKREGYSPAKYVTVRPSVICGVPDRRHISTSLIERQNLTIRTYMRRFTRLSIAFSKRLDCLKSALAIHFWHYNFVRRHGTLRVTPAMAAGIARTFSNWDEILK